MGSYPSYREFVRDDTIPGRTKSTLVFGKKMHIRRNELDRLFHEYTKFEDPKSHKAAIKDILDHHKVEYTIFNLIYFQFFDKTKSEHLNFQEYVIIIWGLLSTDEDALARLCFSLFDTERSDCMDICEVNFLVQTIWSYKAPEAVVNALKKFDQNQDGVVTVAEFTLINRHHPMILEPVRETKLLLQKLTVHSRLWKQITTERVRNMKHKPFFEIVERNVKDSEFVMSSMEYLMLRPEVPVEYIEQWKFLMKKRASRGLRKVELPYEVEGNLESFSKSHKGLAGVKLRKSIKSLVYPCDM